MVVFLQTWRGVSWDQTVGFTLFFKKYQKIRAKFWLKLPTTCLTDLHVLQLLLVDRDLLTDHLLAGLLTDLPAGGRRPLVVVSDVAVAVVDSLPPVAFLPDYLPAVSSPVAAHILHWLLGPAAVPVVLHLALDALHGHHLGLAALAGGLVQAWETWQ